MGFLKLAGMLDRIDIVFAQSKATAAPLRHGITLSARLVR
jgi:hypothetical protein